MINENMIYRVQRMFHDRCVYYECAEGMTTNRDFRIRCNAMVSAYSSAYDILLAAIQGNVELLKEFDYFGKDE